MSKSKVQFVASVRQLLDAKDDLSTTPRWTQAEIEASIEYALNATVNILHSAGYSDIKTRSVFVLDATGSATIGQNDGVSAVYSDQGNGSYLERIKPGNGANRSFAGYPMSGSVMIEYIQKSTLPALDADIVTYAGIDLNDAVVDKFAAYLAAMDLKTVEAEGNAQIEKLLPVLEAQIRQKYSVSVQVAPAVNYYARGTVSFSSASRWFRSSPTTISIYS